MKTKPQTPIAMFLIVLSGMTFVCLSWCVAGTAITLIGKATPMKTERPYQTFERLIAARQDLPDRKITCLATSALRKNLWMK